MKRIFFIILVIGIVLSITSCKSGQSFEPTTTPTQTSTSIPTITPTPTPTPAPTATPIGGGSGEILFSSSVQEKAKLENGNTLLYTGEQLNLLEFDPRETKALISKDQMVEILSKDLYRTRFLPSPDGKQVLITASTAVSFGEFDTYEYYIASLDLSSLVPILDAGATAINWIWSPDGSMLLGDTLIDNSKLIYIVNNDGSGLRKLIENPTITDPEWSFDGSKVYWLAVGLPMVTDLDGTNTQLLDGLLLIDKSFSPDGKKVAYLTEDSELYIADDDFSNAQLISGDFNSVSCHGQFPSKFLDWSGDSQYIIFQSNSCLSIGGQLFPSALEYLFQISDGGLVKVGIGAEFCGWSPDNKFVYIKERDEGNQLVLVDVEFIGTAAEVEISYSGRCPSWIP